MGFVWPLSEAAGLPDPSRVIFLVFVFPFLDAADRGCILVLPICRQRCGDSLRDLDSRHQVFELEDCLFVWTPRLCRGHPTPDSDMEAF